MQKLEEALSKNRRPQRASAAGQTPTISVTKIDSKKENRWKDPITLTLALWGAIISTGVAIRDTINSAEANVPRFYVRAALQGSDVEGTDQKPVGKIVVTIANVGSSSATLDPNLGVMTINGRTTEKEVAELSFTESSTAGSPDSYFPGKPPSLKTGDEATAVLDHAVLPIATHPLDYLAVRFKLIDGRPYVALISEPGFITRNKPTGHLIGWGGGAMATTTSWVDDLKRKMTEK